MEPPLTSNRINTIPRPVHPAMRLCMFEGQNFSLRRGDVVLGKSGAIGFSCTEGESVFVCFSIAEGYSYGTIVIVLRTFLFVRIMGAGL